MARDQFSIHISRKPGPGTGWSVDTLRFSSDLGRHSIYPEGRKLHDVLHPCFAETILDAVATLDREHRLLNRPDFAFAIEGVGLQGMFCHLDQMNDGLVRVTVRIRAVLGSAIRLLAERDLEIAAKPAEPALSRAEIAAVTALERVLLPLMNATEALQHRLGRLPVDMRLTLLLAQVREGCTEAGALAREVLDRASSQERPGCPGGLPQQQETAGADRQPRMLPVLLDAWSRDAAGQAATQDRG